MSISTGNSRHPMELQALRWEGDKTTCRFCGAPLEHLFVDLGMQPLANTYPTAADLKRMEPFYPLRVMVCERCFLTQLETTIRPEHLFHEYAYFSSYSESWLRHAEAYAEMAIERFGLGGGSRVIEIASNDGYLLRHFARRGIPVLGVDPAANVADLAIAHGIPTIVDFFGREVGERLAADGTRADLLVGNNVLGHVPALNDFVSGLRALLAPHGVLTLEFPHLMRIVAENQFDTIYHEHVSYFSLTTVSAILEAHGLAIFDVEELHTHGGSLRVLARHAAHTALPVSPCVDDLRACERAAGLTSMDAYLMFADKVQATKRAFLGFLIRAKREGKSVGAYGAPAKGNTLLNYCGIRSDFVEWTVDRSPYKQGRFLPGTHIPIYHPDRIREAKPDYLLILPWNLTEEITGQVAYIREWGGRFVTAIPEVRVSR